MKTAFTSLAATALLLAASLAEAETNWSQVDSILGKKAAVSGTVHRYGLPRSDLHVTLDGVSIEPGLALGGWIAFGDRLPGRTLVLMLGDLPMMTADDLAALIAAHAAGTVTIVPSDTDDGTSAIMIDEGTPMAFAFGAGSFARHMANAGALARRFDCPGLAADLDRPEDVARVLAHGGAHSRVCLAATRRDAA